MEQFIEGAAAPAALPPRRSSLPRMSSAGGDHLATAQRWNYRKRKTLQLQHLERIPSKEALPQDLPTVAESTAEQRVTEKHRAWRYVEGIASGLVDHLEGKERQPEHKDWDLLGTGPGTSSSLAVLIALFATGCADPCGLAALPAWTEGPV
eukprot:CAMPEP_0115739434 /NCGR_PEP_ID=MMETSP0272-20121206/88938_1 /TAXON_ID=71861 /ORGANISM="Scrippsiella trochoidea, Strain CCMP3099" /LENGTH=150 /DNA_ID=CAMNT_0003183981 /DNA_START=32 /DNA_END=481 /DNA_ORIENTATION=+